MPPQKHKKPAKLPPPGPVDGAYKGVFTPAPGLSKHPCNVLTVEDFEIDRGKVVALPGVLSFEGTMTSAGFLSGFVRYIDDAKVPIQGRTSNEKDGIHLRAGVIDDQAGCAWTMDLKKQ